MGDKFIGRAGLKNIVMDNSKGWFEKQSDE